MSFDRSHPKRQRLEIARPDHVYSAQSFNSNHCSTYCQESLIGVHDSHPSTIINVPRSRTTPKIEAETTVCYGMMSEINAHLPSISDPPSAFSAAVQLLSCSTFIVAGQTKVQGSIDTASSQLLQALLDEPVIDLQVLCEISPLAANVSKSQARARSRMPCKIAIIIYGPNNLFEDVGKFFEEHGICLEDPNGCDRDVLYRNPHRMTCSDASECVLTLELDTPTIATKLIHLPVTKDLLEDFNNSEDLAEAPQPIGLNTKLVRHQKQALTFLLRREHGWTFEPGSTELWEEHTSSHGRFFINNITGSHHAEEPPQCHGGILADPMGLGKTLSIVSLILATRLHFQDSGKPAPTLVILPVSLLNTWEEELSQHVLPGIIKWTRCHGSSRPSTVSALDSYDIVFTTYHTVASEWRKNYKKGTSSLFSTHWQRVVLDEAHWIRNCHTQMAKAVFSLNSVSRWAVTGTPLQNSLSDFSSLLQFIRAAPYSDGESFDADITRVWKSGNVEEATKRLKRLLCCVLLRRAKSTIKLPPRHDTVCPLDFSKEERFAYDEAKGEALKVVDEALMSGPSAPKNYVNALQRINNLRTLCNMGTHRRRPISMLSSVSPLQDWSTVAQQASNVLAEFGDMVCHHCGIGIEASDSSAVRVDPLHSPFLSSCGRLTCWSCKKRLLKNGADSVPCGHTPSCPAAPVASMGLDTACDSPPYHDSAPLPTKIAAVVSQLSTLDYSIKSVVFSYWTSTLDLIQQGLEREGIDCVRFDGQATLKQRNKAVQAFRSNPSIRVMLLSLSCGAVGLNLTVASRAYLIEPHWNPTLEEQALARIHRLGQTKEVTTVRFYMRNSFEEHVMKIQQNKKDLADLLLVPNNESQGSTNVRRLEESVLDQ
ncbi:hypothetical protein EG327_005975 [Venturia inaequalis]|uniref:Uncharacterized protein n=2 Tax=Venturia inaequalis TaxID=5025 RepID=A0A8H3Z3P3_VENIN|nr:hypothetical protein EG327_005975 [Venturia inaequalis]